MTTGEEKFYSPREDLEALKTSIDTLNTNIVALNKNILIMTAKAEALESATDTTESADDFGEVISKTLSTTKDAFLRTLIITAQNEDGSPLLSYDSDILINMDQGGAGSILTCTLFEGGIKPGKLDGDTTHTYYKTIILNNTRLPANTILRLFYYCQNIRAATDLTFELKYVLATF